MGASRKIMSAVTGGSSTQAQGGFSPVDMLKQAGKFPENTNQKPSSEGLSGSFTGSGVKGFDGFFTYAEKMSPLGNASAEDCANYCVFLFSDLSRKITMQNLFHDGGFSNTGISEEIIDSFN